jgi:hypothetical protein
VRPLAAVDRTRLHLVVRPDRDIELLLLIAQSPGRAFSKQELEAFRAFLSRFVSAIDAG